MPFTEATPLEAILEAFAPQIRDRIFLITGTSAGNLGAHTAITLARGSPAHIILVARNQAKVAPVIAEIARLTPNVKTTFVRCDLTDQSSVRSAARTILADESIPRI